MLSFSLEYSVQWLLLLHKGTLLEFYRATATYKEFSISENLLITAYYHSYPILLFYTSAVRYYKNVSFSLTFSLLY